MTKKANNEKSNQKGRIDAILADERLKTALALILTGVGVFMLIAFISYFFTWKADYVYAELPLFEDSSVLTGKSVDNWAGKIGARFALKVVNHGFGLASIFIPLVMIVLGLWLVKVKLTSIGWALRVSATGMVLLSVILGFLFGQSASFGGGLGGAHGFFMAEWLKKNLGTVGTAILLMLTTFLYLTFGFSNFFGWFSKTMKSLVTMLKKSKTVIFEKKKAMKKNIVKINEKENIVEDEVKEIDNEIQEKIAAENEVDEIAFENVIEEQINENESDENDEDDVDDIIETTETKDNPRREDVVLTIKQKQRNEEIVATETPYIMEDIAALGEYDPTLELSRYQIPPIELLADHKSDNSEISNDEHINNKNRIVETLKSYGIEIDRIEVTPGPSVTLYEIEPAQGVRSAKIKSLENDIALRLAALGIRIIAPVPGRGTIGIELPNLHPEIVSMRAIIASRPFQEAKMELPIALGKTISNETLVFDLTKMPHLLVAGSTGQGKSVGLNAIIASILYKKHPSQVKMVMVDPKSVEFHPYEKIENHFLAKLPDAEEAIITDTQKVIHTINSLCIEMDTRYSLLKDAGVRKIKEYNGKFIARKLNPNLGHRYLPYIVVVIDEYADLVMTAGKEIELPIARLAQKARAAGIHMIIATQRPTTNIITGVIKANFPARIAFRVISAIDSRTILDGPGANQLIGRGDLLFTSGGELTRVQCAFIDTPEIEKITNFIGSQQGYPHPLLLPEYSAAESADPKDIDLSKKDDLFDDAARLIVVHQQGSTSLIQRKFSIGYNRAGRIMDQLEAAGIVGPSEGSKARQVLFIDETSLENYLNKMKAEIL